MATDYNDRPNAPDSGSGTKSDLANDEFVGLLQERLLNQADAVSSFDTEIESSIKDAVSGIRKSNEASTSRIQSVYDREIGYTRDLGNRAFTTAQEGQRGYATQVQALRMLTESTEKDVKDLEQRKQEAILLGDSAAAEKIADLQLKSLEFKQNAMQNTFQNLLGVGGFALQRGQLDISKGELEIAKGADARAQEQFNFQKEQAMANVALQYGLEVSASDTLSSIINKAMPFASEDRQLNLRKAQKEIEQMDASIANMRSQIAERNATLSSSDLDNIVKYSFGDPSVISEIKAVDRDRFFKKRSEYEKSTFVPALVRDGVSNDMSLAEINEIIEKSPVINDVFQAKAVAKELYETESVQDSRKNVDYGSPLLNMWNGLGFGERDKFTGFPGF